MSNTTSPPVTVVLPVKNGLPFLPEAVESILSQTFRDFEFVIIDDGSTDGTTAYLRALRDPRLRLLRNESGRGVAASLNQGIAASASPFIARQDADDISEPERLAKQVEYMAAHPECIVLGTQCCLIDQASNFVELFPRPSTEADLREMLRRQCPLIHGSVLMRRAQVVEAGGYREKIRYAEDYDLWLRLAAPRAIANHPEALYRYRRHEGQICTANYNDSSFDSFLCRVLHLERECTGEEDSLSVLDAEQMSAIKLRKIWRPRGDWPRRVRVLWRYAQLLQSDSPLRSAAARLFALTGGW